MSMSKPTTDLIRGIVDSHRGPALLDRFRIMLPRIDTTNPVELDALARAVIMPGKALNTIERKVSMKPTEVVTGYNTEQTTIQFMDTNDATIARYIDHWQNQAVDPSSHLLRFKNEYTKHIAVIATDRFSHEPTYAMVLLNAFPKTKVAINYSDFSKNSLVELGVVFSYDDYVVVPRGAFGGDSVLENIIGAAADYGTRRVAQGQVQEILDAVRDRVRELTPEVPLPDYDYTTGRFNTTSPFG